YLQHDGAAGQVRLFRQEHAGERPPTQLLDQAEAEQVLPDARQRQRSAAAAADAGHRTQDRVVTEQAGQRVAMLREAFLVFRGARLLAALAALLEILEEEAGHVRIGLRVGRP